MIDGRARQVCVVAGCPELRPCAVHPSSGRDPRSSRNHRGVRRQARAHGADYDQAARAAQGRPCEMRLPACTGIASGADLVIPASQGGTVADGTRPGCKHCQRAQGGQLAAVARVTGVSA